MLPAERNERWVMRVGIAVLVAMALYVAGWVALRVYHSLTRIHKAYNVNVDETRAPIRPMIELS